MSEYRTLRDAVWAARLPTAELVVALRLVEHWPRIMPSVAGLAEYTGLSERAVQYALRDLETRKIIRCTPQPGRCSLFEFLDTYGNPIVIPSLKRAPGVQVMHPTPAPGAPPGACSAPPTPAPGAPEADKIFKQTNKQESEAGARELLPHEKAEARKALEPPTGARPVGLFTFREGWKPPERLRQLGLQELGLTDAEMIDRLKHCRLKLYERPFRSEAAQFERELRWLAEDKKTKAFRKANPHGRDENPGARRSASDPAPAPVFGRIRAG